MNTMCFYGCGHDTKGSGVGAGPDETGEGRLSCRLCWEQRHPFKKKVTFLQVLNNGDDAVLARQIVERVVPEPYQQAIMDEFNNEMMTRYCARLQNLLDERAALLGAE